MILIPYKGMSLAGVLVALTVFSGILLSFQQWTSYQSRSAVEIYQRFQAIQIAENQQQRQLFGLPCQAFLVQNQIPFQVNCQDKIVRYPMGEIAW